MEKMSRRMNFLRKPHEKDYEEYLEYYRSRVSPLQQFSSLERFVKPIHRKNFYLNLFVNALEVDREGKKYLNEIIVDFILIMDLFSQNYIKNVRMSLRSAIEEFNRYFLIQHGFDCSKLPISRINESALEICRLDSLIHEKVSMLCSDYVELCNTVHVSAESSFTDKLVLSDFQAINERKNEKVARQIYRTIECFIFILICIHTDVFNKLNKHDQNYILQQLPQIDYKKAISRIDS